MNATALLRSPSLILLGAALVAQAPPPIGMSVEDVLPASTYATARFGGLAACSEAAGQMPLAQIVHDFLHKLPAEVREQHLDRGLGQAAEHVQAALQRVGLRPSDLRAVLGQPMALALGRLSIEGMGPSVALVIEQGPHAEAVQRCVAALTQLATRLHGDVSVETTTVNDVEVQQLHLPEGPPIFTGAVAGFFVITNSRGYLGELCDVVQGKAAGLGRSSSLGNARGQLQIAPLASLFVNLASVNASIAPHLPYEAAAWSDALGIGGLDSLYVATAADGNGGKDVLRANIGGSEKGLLKAMSAQPVHLDFAKACSKNTVVFGAETVDIASTIDAFQRLLKLLPAAVQQEVGHELGREMQREFRHLGTTPAAVDRMIRAFGTEIGFAIALEKGAVPKPELLLRIAVRDAGPIGALLQQLEGMTSQMHGLEWKSRKAGDNEVRFCNVPLPAVNLQISPCYVLQADALWIASDTAAMLRAMRQTDDAADSLAAQPDFEELSRTTVGASSLLHVRWFRGVELGWRNVETLLYPMLDSQRDRIGFGSDSLPDAETMARALGTSTIVYRVDDDAVSCESRGPITVGALLSALGAAADQVLMHATAKVY